MTVTVHLATRPHLGLCGEVMPNEPVQEAAPPNSVICYPCILTAVETGHLSEMGGEEFACARTMPGPYDGDQEVWIQLTLF